ncbi:MAG: RNA polymerase sporulation sigma factor SigK [Clostridia bacterium]|nr:RNA polymerase sporulation sigma factor SigK [Clostridia bacterium]
MTGFLLFFLKRFFFLMLRASGSGGSFPPPLTAAEEKEAFRKCREGDKAAREKLILHNLRLVAHIVKKYYTSYKEQDDLISIGTVGLIKAIDSFKPETGTRFATYAGKCLQNEILMYFRSQKKLNMETSINDSVDVDKDGNPLTYIDIISTDEDIVEEIDRDMKLALVRRGIERVLTDKERTVIELRYGLKGDGRCLAQREVAEALGISRSYVSRLEKSGLEKIHKYVQKGG